MGQGSALVDSNQLNIADGIFESASDYHDVTIDFGNPILNSRFILL